MSNVKYEVSGSTLSITRQDEATSQCTLPWPIAQVLAFAGILVVRVEPPQGIRFNENVYGVLPDGSVAWQVEVREYVYDDSPFTGLVRYGDNVKLMNWDGLELLVVPISGKEMDERYGR